MTAEEIAAELWAMAQIIPGEGIEDAINRMTTTIQRAFEEREWKLREALKEISELHGEINPSNYDHDDACELNRQFCYALTVADLALKETLDAQ